MCHSQLERERGILPLTARLFKILIARSAWAGSRCLLWPLATAQQGAYYDSGRLLEPSDMAMTDANGAQSKVWEELQGVFAAIDGQK